MFSANKVTYEVIRVDGNKSPFFYYASLYSEADRFGLFSAYVYERPSTTGQSTQANIGPAVIAVKRSRRPPRSAPLAAGPSARIPRSKDGGQTWRFVDQDVCQCKKVNGDPTGLISMSHADSMRKSGDGKPCSQQSTNSYCAETYHLYQLAYQSMKLDNAARGHLLNARLAAEISNKIPDAIDQHAQAASFQKYYAWSTFTYTNIAPMGTTANSNHWSLVEKTSRCYFQEGRGKGQKAFFVTGAIPMRNAASTSSTCVEDKKKNVLCLPRIVYTAVCWMDKQSNNHSFVFYIEQVTKGRFSRSYAVNSNLQIMITSVDAFQNMQGVKGLTLFDAPNQIDHSDDFDKYHKNNRNKQC